MIYNVVSNLKHNGKYYPAGSFIEAEEGTFPELVAAGVLSPVLGAKSTEDAQAILEKQADADAQAKAAAEAAQPKNTWGPQGDKPKENVDAPVKLDRLNLAALQTIASEKNIPLAGDETRKQLIALIEAADKKPLEGDGSDSTSADNTKKTDSTDTGNPTTPPDETGDNL